MYGGSCVNDIFLITTLIYLQNLFLVCSPPPKNLFAILITVLFFVHLAEDTPGTRMQCISKSVKDEEYPSWLHRYRAYYHRLFVIHHKYNAINEGALADAVAKWTQAGAIITGLGLSHFLF